MKVSALKLIRKAEELNGRAESILHSFDDIIRRVLDDDTAGLSFATDGVVVVYRRGMDNSFVNFIDFDAFLNAKSEHEALAILDSGGI